MSARAAAMLMGLLASLGAQPPAPSVPTTSPAKFPTMAEVDAEALQGDMRIGLTLLKVIPPGALSPQDRERRECLLARFSNPDPPDPGLADPFAETLAKAYLRYWTDSLLQRNPQSEARSKLLADLQKVLIHFQIEGPWKTQSLDQVTESLGPLLEARGLHSIRGVTAPYYDLLLWQTETPRTYQVDLPEGPQPTKVVFLSGFLLHGWEGYATCGRFFPGGWTTPEALYCDRDSYDLESEAFRVSYLGHEAQHFFDETHFSGLDQPELEYRAKLVELTLAHDTLQDLLQSFASRRNHHRETPHPFANDKVIQELSLAVFGDASAAKDPSLWKAVRPEKIHAAARRLLEADTKNLERKRKSTGTNLRG